MVQKSKFFGFLNKNKEVPFVEPLPVSESYMPEGEESNEVSARFSEIESSMTSLVLQAEADKNIPNVRRDIIPNYLFTHSYNGEKNEGEVGPVKRYAIDYDTLRARSWQYYLDSELAQTVIKRKATWVVGAGLKAQSEPVKTLLESEGITLDIQAFSKLIEARFGVFKQAQWSDYSGMRNLDAISKTAYVNSKVGGDVLVILRYIDNCVKVQLIDGAHVQSPIGTEYMPLSDENGNSIMHGIERDKFGKHVRYYIRNANLTYTPVEAWGKNSGLQMAYMVYGFEYRIDNVRGLPLLSCVIETISKLERYKEATIGSAEERAKLAYFFEHQIGAVGTNPFSTAMAEARDVGGTPKVIPTTDDGVALAKQVAATTKKAAFNMPVGSTVKAIDQKDSLYFKDFYQINAEIICATVEIPPNIAFSKYDANFSASRAALKDWENTLNVDRKDFGFQFMQPIWNFFLEIQILNNKIQAPGYLVAKQKRDMYIVDAYRNTRFVGVPVPHIDPLKEVNAIRKKLGSLADHIPLTTGESATEDLMGGEFSSNIEQFANELKGAEALGIKMAEPPINVVAPPVPVPEPVKKPVKKTKSGAPAPKGKE